MKLLAILLIFVSAALADENEYEKIAYEFTDNQPEVIYWYNFFKVSKNKRVFWSNNFKFCKILKLMMIKY